ncbi:MAG: hypothetical protein NC236_00535 [Mycoplasma sp.]|nr:hypothetical protein [Mycoplasma sp.]
MKLMPNIRIKNIELFIEKYKNIFDEINSYKVDNKIKNATIKINDEYFKVFNSMLSNKESFTFYFSKDEKDKIESLISKIKVLNNNELKYYEEAAVGYFFAQINDNEFNFEFNFQRYDVLVPNLVNIYSSQLPLLLNLGLNKVIQREQREGIYWADFLNKHESISNVKKMKFKEKVNNFDYVLIDKLDEKYNTNVLDFANDKIYINYGWDENGQSDYKYENNDITFNFKNDVKKQAIFTINNLAKEGLIDKNISLEIIKKQEAKNNEAIKNAKKILQKYHGKNIGFVFHWQSKNQFFDKNSFDKEQVIISLPSWLPFIYDELGFNFPEINDNQFIKETYNKYSVTDFKEKRICEKFKNKFDILIYLNNDAFNVADKDLELTKKMIKENGKFINCLYSKFNPAAKSIFGIEHFINNLVEVLK